MADDLRMRETVSSSFPGVVPESRPRWAASWLTKPSASGSLNGTPSSSTSTPISSNASARSCVASRSGSPAPMYTTNPFCPSCLRR